MSTPTVSRRQFIGSSTAAVAGIAAASRARADGPFSDGFPFEIRRPEAEWREILTDQEYRILREGGTEARFTSDLADETRPGLYYCKGSDLAIYSHLYKVQLPFGWVFFRHAIPDTVMLGIDGPPPELNEAGMLQEAATATVEVHCRRTGSHLGHMVCIDGEIIHCINGTALEFVPEA